MKKKKTQAEYFRRINMALEFIEQQLDQNIRLEDVAAVSHFSPYHFHRIFHALVGETVNDYISRKRMEKGARMLMCKPDMNISAIALAGGFSSSANFAKAFKLYFGVSPSEFRNYQPQNPAETKDSKNGKLYSKYGKAFNPQDLYSQFVTQLAVFEHDKLEELLMKIKVEEIQDKLVAYLSSPKGYELDSVHTTWDRVIRWAEANGIDNGVHNKFAICHDNPVITPEDKCRYDAAVVIGSDTIVQPPFKQSVIPGGKYAVVYYKDVGEKISNFMTELCSQWFPDSGYEPDDYPAIFNYLNYSRNDDIVEMDIYIKIKELSVV